MINKKITNVYLVGQISNKYEETFNWRRKICNEFETYSNINIINPCNSKHNYNLFNKENKEKDFFKFKGIDLIVSKDRKYVMDSDICICNLNIYDHEQPFIGSFFELAWFYDCPEKTVIGFSYTNNPNEHPFLRHPFIKQTIDHLVKNVYEACELIDLYFNDVER